MYKYQIGISYASEQEILAERLCTLLNKKGVKVFFAKNEESNFLTENLYSHLIDIYENECKYIIAIISKEYIEKDYTNQELSVALQRNTNGERCLIPIHISDIRHPKISSDEYYIDYNKKKEPEIVNNILKLIKNNKIIEDGSSENVDLQNISKESSLLKISRDYLVFISGATGVGKSTIARNLLNIIPEFVIIEEADMLREAVRGENDRIIEKIAKYAQERNRGKSFSKQNLQNLLKYDTLNKSTIDLQYSELNDQCKLILEPLEKVCYRLMDKGMPAIVEGVNLSFEAMFEKKDSLYYTLLNSHDTLFFNLYVSNEEEHKNRLIQRSNDRRENAQTRHKYLQKFNNIRNANNQQSSKALEYAQKYSNVYNIDTTGSIEYTISQIIEIIKSSNL